jgi:hypothetical protein
VKASTLVAPVSRAPRSFAIVINPSPSESAYAMFVGYLDRDGDLEDCYSAGDAFVFA